MVIPPPFRKDTVLESGHALQPHAMDTPGKTLSPLATIAAAYNICQSWVAIGATFALSVGHGGNVTVIYGLVVIAVLYTAIALAIAELAAQYPTAGGQYHWSAILAPPRIRREVVSFLMVIASNRVCLKYIIELSLRMYQYYRLDYVDGQHPHHTAANHYRSHQILLELLHGTTLACGSNVSGSQCRRCGIQRFRVAKSSLDPQRWL